MTFTHLMSLDISMGFVGNWNLKFKCIEIFKDSVYMQIIEMLKLVDIYTEMDINIIYIGIRDKYTSFVVQNELTMITCINLLGIIN